MKLLHLSDFHIGKTVNGFSMIDDQEYILNEIIKIIDNNKPDIIAIAGDIYDRSVPSADAIMLFDSFLKKISIRGIETFIISGNHDSAERNAFASSLIDKSGIHFSPVYSGIIKPFEYEDDFGKLNVYMLPFIKPITISEVFKDTDKPKTYTDALKFAIEKMEIDSNSRNVLISHQFVTGAIQSDSEEKSLGGMDNVDADTFNNFDYVALGHIHRPQKITDKIRYSGSPLKYSFSEIRYNKSATLVTIKEKGSLKIETIPLIPKRDMREIKGTYNELVSKDYYDDLNRNDYYHIILTDEDDILDALDRLRVIYPNIMALDYDNKRTRALGANLSNIKVDDILPVELFSNFYQEQNGKKLDTIPKEYIKEMIKEIWEKK